MIRTLKINGKEIEVEVISKSAESIEFFFEGKQYCFSKKEETHGRIVLQNEENENFTVYKSASGIYDSNSEQYKISRVQSATNSHDDMNAETNLISPLPGKVIKVSAKEGQKVKAGDEILRIEAMKMEHSICSNIDGKVKSIKVNEGDSVVDGQLLSEIE